MTVRRTILAASLAIACLMPAVAQENTVIHHPGEPPPYKEKVGKKSFTVPQQISWHLSQAKAAVAAGKTDQAYGHWLEVLRLDPQNAAAFAGIKEFAVKGTQDALARFAAAKGLTETAQTLDNQTADIMGQRLLIADRDAIQSKVANDALGADPRLADDFDAFISASNLTAMLQIGDYVSDPSESQGRLYGRNLVSALAAWIPRLQKCGIEIDMTRPHGYQDVAGVPNTKFTLMGTSTVLIDGVSVTSAAGTPSAFETLLQASYENGAWRIGPRGGSLLLYAFSEKPFANAPHRPRSVDGP